MKTKKEKTIYISRYHKQSGKYVAGSTYLLRYERKRDLENELHHMNTDEDGKDNDNGFEWRISKDRSIF